MAKESGVKVEDKRKEMNKRMNFLLSRKILVGIPSATSQREDSHITNAALGYIHETGSPVRNIPARPFLNPGIKSVENEISNKLKEIGKLALNKKEEQIEQKQEALGLFCAGAVQEYMSDARHFVPLAPSTIAERKSRGRQPPYSPLIDTGKLRASISYVIRNETPQTPKDKV